MKFKFECGICKKEVSRGDKFEVQLDQYKSNCELVGVACEDPICFTCAGKIERKIQSMRRAANR